MFYSKIFREEAVARRSRPEPLDRRLQVTAPHEWMVLVGLGLSLLAFLAWGLFGRVERTFSAAAVVVQPGERYAVVSPVSGTVIEVLAEVGDTVERGQAIARVRLPEAERQARITQTIVSAVRDGMRDAESAELRESLIAAARSELAAVELRAGESIVARSAGSLVAYRLVAGEPVRAGQTVAWVRSGSAEAWQAFAFVSPQDAGRLAPGRDAEAPGRDAEVLVALPEQPGVNRLGARVLEVSLQPVDAPAWLADLGLAPPAPAHLLRVVLIDPPPDLRDGADGQVRIMLGRQSPAALLAGGGD